MITFLWLFVCIFLIAFVIDNLFLCLAQKLIIKSYKAKQITKNFVVLQMSFVTCFPPFFWFGLSLIIFIFSDVLFGSSLDSQQRSTNAAMSNQIKWKQSMSWNRTKKIILHFYFQFCIFYVKKKYFVMN